MCDFIDKTKSFQMRKMFTLLQALLFICFFILTSCNDPVSQDSSENSTDLQAVLTVNVD